MCNARRVVTLLLEQILELGEEGGEVVEAGVLTAGLGPSVEHVEEALS